MPAPDLTRAIERNTASALMSMGRAGGGQQIDRPGLRWSIGGSPIEYHNCVVEAELTTDEADEVIQASIDQLRTHQVPGSWHVGPSMRPTDLPLRLQKAGFVDGGTEPGMALLFTQLRQPPPPAGVRIERVVDSSRLAVWAETLALGFGEGEREARWVGQVFTQMLDDPRWRHYLALRDGLPVGTTSCFMEDDVAGIYFVMAVPAVRRQGVGAFVTAAALQDAADERATVGVLTSSELGRRVYARLGMAEICQIALYEWSPDLSS